MFNGGVGPLELLLVLGIVLLIFGPKRLPGLGRQLGRGMREFKESITGGDKDDDAPPAPAVTRAAPDEAVVAPETRAPAAEPLGGEPTRGRGGAA